MNRTNSKSVVEAVDKHIKTFYETEADLAADYHAVNDKAEALVEGGNFLISYHDQRNFLDSLQLNNNSGREFTDDQVFKMYITLLSRGIKQIVEGK